MNFAFYVINDDYITISKRWALANNLQEFEEKSYKVRKFTSSPQNKMEKGKLMARTVNNPKTLTN